MCVRVRVRVSGSRARTYVCMCVCVCVWCSRRYNTMALHWQFANPSGTAEECLEMLLQQKEEGQ